VIPEEVCTCPGGQHILDGAPCDPYAESDAEYTPRCPACGDPIDYCQGHGEIGDPAGRAILDAHDAGDHSGCHPEGCEEAPR